MKQPFIPLLLFSFFLSIVFVAPAQIISYKNNIALSKDSGNIQKLINLIKGKPDPLIDSTNIAINRFMLSIASFQGKKINSIKIEQRHFGSVINSAIPPKENAFIKFANSLHNKTSESTIRKNLFFKVQDTINPLVIAYNEKWLHDLTFIQDARIVTYPSANDTNQVDVYVITKDILPIGGAFNLREATSFESRLNTENISDGGDAFSIGYDFDQKRTVSSGWAIGYTARNILGSFVDVNIAAKQYASNYASGSPTASILSITGNRPLLTPLSRWTYGFDIQQNKNNNVYSNWTDSLYKSSLQYNLKKFDAWAGYQIVINNKKFKIDNPRYFIQLRYWDNNYLLRPTDYLNKIDRNYQQLKAYFSSFTIFKQKIIRTQYLYGFGRNEDLPDGKSLTITSGHYSVENESLPYAGIQLESYKVFNEEKFRHLNINIGSSYIDKEFQDFRFLASLEQISKLYYLESGYRYRQIINLSFTELLRSKFNDPLLINSFYGIPQLNREKINGATRATANWESIWYNSKPYWGFKMAPFAFANVSYIRTLGNTIGDGDIYSSFGGGFRVRNESLIFGTIELKGFYFPRTTAQTRTWNFSIVTNLRFKYNSSIINKPDFVPIN